MISITLKRSGGQLGKSLQATRKVDIDEEALVKKLTLVKPAENPHARDDFYHSITIAGKKTFPIDIGALKGSLKKLISEMEDDLKIESE